ncbi:MAG: 3-dehydroquinate synthase [Candidatus Omnitrophota bacterium]
MKKISVNLGDRKYAVSVGAGIVSGLPEVIKSLNFTGPIVLITDSIVKATLYKNISAALKGVSNKCVPLVVPAGEKAKSIEVFMETVQAVSRKTKGYNPLVLAFGGGVVGDLSGFIASAYRRGIPYIQIPTTLLAQVDSAIGGKVGIDLPEAKNLIGAFYQPKAVIADVDFLCSLPKRQIRNGLSEVIKYAVISSPKLFSFLEENIEKVLRLDKKTLIKIIAECVSIKARVVEKDERDSRGVRIFLNFGHTLGHAVEAASGYSGRYNHGESVAIGMIMAAEIAVELDMMKKNDFDRIKTLIRKAGLPETIQGLSLKEIMYSHGFDKKFVEGANRFVLPRKIGSVESVEHIPELLIKTVLRKHVG